jgi:hypothetical protein
LIPTEVRDLLGPAPLAPGEDATLYERLLAEISSAVQPSGILEWLQVQDLTNLTWKLQRGGTHRSGAAHRSSTRRPDGHFARPVWTGQANQAERFERVVPR